MKNHPSLPPPLKLRRSKKASAGKPSNSEVRTSSFLICLPAEAIAEAGSNVLTSDRSQNFKKYLILWRNEFLNVFPISARDAICRLLNRSPM